MQEKASKSDDIAEGYDNYKIGFRKVATNSGDVSTLVSQTVTKQGRLSHD